MALTTVKSDQIQTSVALAGSPTTTTQSASDNSTKVATTAYVETAVANLVASAPAALNTLDELAAALNDDASFSTTITNSIATKLPLAGGTMTGSLTTSGNLLINAASGNPYVSIKTAGTGNNPFTEYRAGNNTVFDTAAIFSGSTDHFRIGYGSSGSVSSDLFTVTQAGNATFAGTGTFAGGSTNNNDDANILTLNASEHARLLVDTSSTSGHRATLALESNGNELTLGTTGSYSYLTSVGNLEISGGNVGIGATSPSYPFHVSTTNENAAFIESSSNNGTYLWVTNSDATTGRTANIGFAPANNVSGARIFAEAMEDFSTSANRTADLGFSTRLNGTMSEKMRIDSSGNVNIGGKDYHSHQTTVDSLQIGYALNLYEDSYNTGTLNYACLLYTSPSPRDS